MITQRKLNIPIFDYKLTVIIYDNWNEIKHLDTYTRNIEESPAGFTKWDYGAAIVAIQSNRENSIIHESLHVKNLIWDYIGYKPQIDNDEVDAYLLTYICIKIKEVFNRHNKTA